MHRSDIHQSVVIRRYVCDIGGVEERSAIEPDVHERGLHPGQNPGHPSLVEVADQTPAARALDVDFLEDVAFDDGGAGLARGDIDEDFNRHRCPPGQYRTPAARNSSAVSKRGSPMTPE